MVWAPLATLIAAVKLLEPHDYPAGDLRNEPLFWGAVALVAGLFAAVMVTMAARRLRQSDADGSSSDVPRR